MSDKADKRELPNRGLPLSGLQYVAGSDLADDSRGCGRHEVTEIYIAASSDMASAAVAYALSLLGL